MILNREVIKESIKIHKNMLSKAFNYKDTTLIENAQALGKDISLAISGFKCLSPRCGATERLQFHHLITTYCRTYMDFWRYVMQRAYWGNIIVLCEDCHTSFHCGMNRAKMDEQLENGKNIYITKNRIEKVKNKFFFHECKPAEPEVMIENKPIEEKVEVTQ